MVVHFGEVANGKPIYHGAQVDGESDAAEGTGKGYEMKYTVHIHPGIEVEGCKRWLVEIDFHPGFETRRCKTQAEAMLWIGDTIMTHAAAYVEQHGDVMEEARR